MNRSVLSCFVALVFVFSSSTVVAAKSEPRSAKKESAPATQTESGDWIYVPGLFYGSKALDKKDWIDMNTQTETGFSVAMQHAEWPMALVAGYAKAEQSGNEAGGFTAKGDTTEIGLGMRFGYGNGSLKYFAEGGLVRIAGKGSYTDTVAGEYAKFSGSTTGHWLGGGVDYLVTDTISLGIEARYSAGIAKVKYAEDLGGVLFEADDIGYELGGTHVGVTVRYFPE